LYVVTKDEYTPQNWKEKWVVIEEIKNGMGSYN